MKSLKQATLIMVHRVFKSKAIGKHSNVDRSCFQLLIVGGLGRFKFIFGKFNMAW